MLSLDIAASQVSTQLELMNDQRQSAKEQDLFYGNRTSENTRFVIFRRSSSGH